MATSCNNTYADLDDGLYAEFTTSKGVILTRLFPEKSPLTVMNFVGLAEGKLDFANKNGPFYDGLTFHRVIEDFVIQGGDPEGSGSGGPGYTFADETNTDLAFDRPGLLAMANSGPNTNGSQFFITRVVTDHLTGRHTIFGEVIKGIDVVMKIEQNDIIEKLKIIRIGDKAKAYKASTQEFKDMEKTLNANIQREKQEKISSIKDDIMQRWPDAQLDDATGIYSIIRNEGTGELPSPGVTIKVHYTGTFMDGNKFDSSRDRDQPFEFILGRGQVIPGWDIMLQKMKIGERRVIVLPPEMAYGTRGGGPIPPDSWLIFDVEVLDFK